MSLVFKRLFRRIKDCFRRYINGKQPNAILLLHSISGDYYEEKSSPLRWDLFLELINRYADKIVPIDAVLREKNRGLFALTFDDGLLDTYEKAFPYLKARKIPFTVFVTVDLIGSDSHMNLEQLRQLTGDPLVTIGSHGYTHSVIRSNNANYELIESKKALEELLYTPIHLIAYPYGQSDLRARIIAKKTYEYGFCVMNLGISSVTRLFRMRLPRFSFGTKTYDRQMQLLDLISREQ